MSCTSSSAAAHATNAVPQTSHAARIDATLRRLAGDGTVPASISFLAPKEASIGALVSAAAQSRLLGVEPHEALIASGEICEKLYYAALARHLGMPFTDDPARLGPGPDQSEAAIAGVAVVAPGSSDFIIAPQGPMVSALLDMRRLGRLPEGRMTMTSPRCLAVWVRRSAARAIAEQASRALPRFDANLSAASGVTQMQASMLAALMTLVAFAGFLWPNIWFAIAQCCTLVMLAGVLARLFAAAASCGESPPPPPLRDAELPHYTLIVPLYREAEVARKLVASLERLDYPRAKLDIKIVLEDDDQTTRAAFAAIALPSNYEIVVAPPGAPRTKPRALNVVLPFVRGGLVTVYDAEDEPERDQLRLAAARFAEAPADVACLQARLAIDNSADSWLTALFAIEYAALFDVVNPGLAALDLPMPLGGTSNHFRVEALRDVRGWDAWNVTEDADLG